MATLTIEIPRVSLFSLLMFLFYTGYEHEFMNVLVGGGGAGWGLPMC